uniref:Uncharacterized protein n=1 Tax=Cairina moschata TaxID=8855 RepID=A0A8C3BEK8_CAIMO
MKYFHGNVTQMTSKPRSLEDQPCPHCWAKPPRKSEPELPVPCSSHLTFPLQMGSVLRNEAFYFILFYLFYFPSFAD